MYAVLAEFRNTETLKLKKHWNVKGVRVPLQLPLYKRIL